MKNKGMTTFEIAVLMTALGLALAAMLPYLSRGIQGRIKTTVDDLAPQFDADKLVSSSSIIQTVGDSTTQQINDAPANGSVTATTTVQSSTTVTEQAKDILRGF